MRIFSFFKRQPTLPPHLLSHADYNLIMHGTEVEGAAIRCLDIGTLNLPTGRIVTCDPLAYPERPPLARKVAPGRYPVRLYQAETEMMGRRIAIAVLVLKEERAERFEMALKEGQRPQDVAPGDYTGFPVDAGLGSFMDEETLDHYQKFLDHFQARHPEGNVYDDHFRPLFNSNAEPPDREGDWINYTFADRPELNLMMFSSGFGDGMYPAYWGITRNGEAVQLIIDFHVLLLPEDTEPDQ